MFDKIVYISDNGAHVKVHDQANLAMNLMNLHVIFEDETRRVLGEVDDIGEGIVKVRFLGEFVNDRFYGGLIRKPTLTAKIRIIDNKEVGILLGNGVAGNFLLGVSPLYNDFPIYANINRIFSNHFVILGNSGSGKSCGVARIIQNLFQTQSLLPYKANMLIMDSSAEYYNAFCEINKINPNYHYRFITTNPASEVGEPLRLPVWLLDSNDIALLLALNSHSQFPIVERMLKLARIFAQSDEEAVKYKNHLIAKAIMTVLYTNETAASKRNEIFSIVATCRTNEFHLEAPIQGIGYVRKFRECFLIDSNGNFTESVLLTQYVSEFIHDEFDNYEPSKEVFYRLEDLEKALNFTLISEGWLRNENTYGDATTVKVRLHALITGSYSKFFDYPSYIRADQYLSSLFVGDGKKYQIVNINLDDVDDSFAKTITKIYSRLFFDFVKRLPSRSSIPFHLIMEEAHRYIQNDDDRYLIGYNIFERIAKEGRKYGLVLGLISQRPVEISETVISQCSNFLIFKMNHPRDLEYIEKMLPNISSEIVEKQKSLQTGTCVGFGTAFQIPLIIKMEMPSPAPISSNCDVFHKWKMNQD